MSILTTMLSQLGNLAQTLAPQILPGSENLIKAGESLSNAFKAIKAENGGQAPADAEAAHNALFQRVKAHADSTLSRLEGGQ